MSPILRTHLRHGRRRGARAATLLAAAPIALALTALPAQAAETRFTEFGCVATEARNVFRVPAGVTSVDVRVQGERGGSNGGLGAYQTGTFAVTAGEQLYVCVGVGGGDGGSTGGSAGGGGGFSSISRNADNSSPLILAAGGGGSGSGPGAGTGGDAATHGGLAGSGGNSTSPIVAGGGGGASSMGDGAGGFSGPSPGTAGRPYEGGRGGSAMMPIAGNGGGGGAGWRSGGGGGGGGSGPSEAGGGGGGGLSLCNVDDCAGGTQVASPSVTFTYAEPPTPTTTTVAATPDRVVYGRDITFTTTVSPAPTGGTVSLRSAGASLGAACTAVPVGVDGRASCTVPVALAAGTHQVDAEYSGSGSFTASSGSTDVRTVNATTTELDVDAGGMPAAGQSLTYVADVAPSPTDGGTVDFTLDGDPLGACQDVAIAGGEARCTTVAPATAGDYTLGASFSGSELYDTSSGSTSFDVGPPALAVSDGALDFGSATIGTPAAAKSVTLTAPGAAVSIEATTIAGASDFTVAGGTCAGVVPAGGSCTVGLAFTPSAAGARSGTLEIATDARGSPHQVALSGSGTARPVDPRTPDTRTPGPRTPDPRAPDARTPDPKPVAPGTSDPRPAPVRGASVSGSAAGRVAVQDSGAVSIPLACPAGDSCRVSGRLTVATSSGARASAAGTTVLARFKGVKLGPKQTKALRLRLPASFVKAAQRRGLRTVRATLTITTVRGDGGRTTTRERITLVLPRAAAQPERRPSFTG